MRSLDGGIGNVICDDFTDSAVLVEFLTEFGDLPPLRPHLLTSSVVGLRVYSSFSPTFSFFSCDSGSLDLACVKTVRLLCYVCLFL